MNEGLIVEGGWGEGGMDWEGMIECGCDWLGSVVKYLPLSSGNETART